MSLASVTSEFTDAETIGYPLLFAGVLIGSIVPIIPTSVVVGVAAAVATTTPHLSIWLVLVVSTLAALGGDLVTFAICRFGGATATRWITRGQGADKLEQVRERFERRGWQIIVIGRLVPAGRIPVLAAAGALRYPWRRLVPASLAAAAIWSIAYAVLGVASGGLFDSPVVAVLLVTVLVLLVSLVMNLVSRRRARTGTRT